MDNQSTVDKLYLYALTAMAKLSVGNRIKYLIDNKVNCINVVNRFGAQLSSMNSGIQQAVSELYQKQLQEQNLWQNSFSEIKQLWGANQIKHIFHKSCGEFPFMSDNLDVLVHPKDYSSAHTLLLDLGYIELRNIQEPHKKFYRRINGDSFCVPVHLHERVCWGVPYDDVNHMWGNFQTAADNDLVNFPSLEDAFITTIAHAFIEDHVFKIGDLIKVAICTERELNWDYIKQNVTSNCWFDAYVVAVECLNYLSQRMVGINLIPERVMSLYKETSKKKFNSTTSELIVSKRFVLPYKLPHLRIRVYSSLRLINDRKMGSKLYNTLCAMLFLVDGIINLKLKYHNQPSYLVTLSGGDGSGKTFFKEYLLKALDLFGLESEEVWMRYGSMPISRNINDLRKKLRGDRPKVEVPSPGHKGDKKYSLLWLMLNSFDMVVLSLRYRISYVLRRKVFVFDRNLLDFLVDFSVNSGRKMPSIVVKLLLLAFPRVNYGVVIKGGTSSEMPLLESEDPALQAFYYDYYLQYFPQFQQVINDMDYTSCDKVVNHTLRSVFGKYPEKYKGYLTSSIKYK